MKRVRKKAKPPFEKKTKRTTFRKRLEEIKKGLEEGTIPTGKDRVRHEATILKKIKERLPELEAMLESVSGPWGYEDPVYRFYHQSFKVYGVQKQTRKIADLLRSLAPEGCVPRQFFEEIMAAGAAGKEFERSHNREWTKQTRPMLEAFFHARYFLEMAVKYGKELDELPPFLPPGWAALCALYGLR
jgi:hypothetical protein